MNQSPSLPFSEANCDVSRSTQIEPCSRFKWSHTWVDGLQKEKTEKKTWLVAAVCLYCLMCKSSLTVMMICTGVEIRPNAATTLLAASSTSSRLGPLTGVCHPEPDADREVEHEVGGGGGGGGCRGDVCELCCSWNSSPRGWEGIAGERRAE